jgi:SAM-dependent methyltransferase
MKEMSNFAFLVCPSCNQKTAKYLGKLSHRAGGIALFDPGSLYECENCGLLFRQPYLPASNLMQQYKDMPSSRWEREKSPDFNLTIQAISKTFSSGRILDVGCYNGDFLEMLPETFLRYGVEPSESARKIAQQKGIEIIGPSIEEINTNRPFFQAITLLDVIEHLPLPFLSLQRLRSLLVPQGLLIISTGNTDSLPWRINRLDYWYYFPEHVSFFSPKWFQWAGRHLDLKMLDFRKFSHFNGSVQDTWRQFARCIAFWIVTRYDRSSFVHKMMSFVYPFSKVKEWSGAPSTHLWHDHMVVVLRSTS